MGFLLPFDAQAPWLAGSMVRWELQNKSMVIIYIFRLDAVKVELLQMSINVRII
jgi:hypothetical protein